jgi:hypothetical protein
MEGLEMFPVRANQSLTALIVLTIILLACAWFPQDDSQDSNLQSTIEAMSTQLVELGEGQSQPTAPPAEITLGGDVIPSLPDGIVPPPSASGLKGELKLLGQYGGSAYAVAVQGDFAFLGQGPRMIVLDISQRSQPRQIGQSELMRGIVNGIALREKYAYVVASFEGLHVFDISQPAKPELVAKLDMETPGCNSITLEGDKALLACNPAGFFIVDISNPSSPVPLGKLLMKGAVLSIANRGETAYVVDWSQDGLAIIDHSNPSEPRQVRLIKPSEVPLSHDMEYPFESVRNCGEYLCIANGPNGLVVLDISQPEKPVALSVFDTNVASGLAADGNTVYVADDMDGVYALDITNPKAIQKLSLAPNSVGGDEFTVQQASERGVFFADGFVYVTDIVYGLDIVDARNPSGIMRASRYTTPVPWTLWDITVQDHYAYVVGVDSGFRVVDVSDPANMREVFFDNERKDLSLQSPTGLVVDGHYAYISDGNYPFHIYDISDPARPVQTGAVYDHPASDGAWDVAIAGDFAFVSGYGAKDAFYPGNGLWVIDISNRSDPKPVKFLELPNGGWQLSISGKTLYALDEMVSVPEITEPLSLRVIDITDPLNPVAGVAIPLGRNSMIGLGGWDLRADGERLFVSMPPMELKVFDISNPLSPVDAGTYTVYQTSSGKFDVEENRLVAGAFQVYDVTSIDQAPVMLASASPEKDIIFETWSFDFVDDLIYIGSSRHGIYVYQFIP